MDTECRQIPITLYIRAVFGSPYSRFQWILAAVFMLPFIILRGQPPYVYAISGILALCSVIIPCTITIGQLSIIFKGRCTTARIISVDGTQNIVEGDTITEHSYTLYTVGIEFTDTQGQIHRKVLRTLSPIQDWIDYFTYDHLDRDHLPDPMRTPATVYNPFPRTVEGGVESMPIVGGIIADAIGGEVKQQMNEYMAKHPKPSDPPVDKIFYDENDPSHCFVIDAYYPGFEVADDGTVRDSNPVSSLTTVLRSLRIPALILLIAYIGHTYSHTLFPRSTP